MQISITIRKRYIENEFDIAKIRVIRPFRTHALKETMNKWRKSATTYPNWIFIL